MSKIRLTKSELKKQKEALKRFQQYLPTLQLKKQQLQSEISKIHQVLEKQKIRLRSFLAIIGKWVAVFAEDIPIEKYLRVTEILTETENIAGVDIPVYQSVGFKGEEYDLMDTPLWVDDGVAAVQEAFTMKVKINILEEQEKLLSAELRITSQRVNLFEKVMIPDTKENIRKIQIFLGDMQTAAVVTGKIAKEKIKKKEMADQT